uniref:Uncharacterized protein n=1 Tax=Anguilla anguilla TaxID=7936 RepID=A0A0E9PC52_ANGAN
MPSSNTLHHVVTAVFATTYQRDYFHFFRL